MSISNSLRGLIRFESDYYSVRDTKCYENEEVVFYTDDSVEECDVDVVDYPSHVFISCAIDAKKVDAILHPAVYSDQAGKNAAYESVALTFSGFGKLVMSNGITYDFYGKNINGIELDFNDTIFKREFLYYENTSDPPGNNVRLHAYGGRYYPGINLSEIEQTFFHVRGNNQGIIVSDLNFWTSRGVDPYTGGVVHGKSDTKIIGLKRDFERRSLGRMINDGCISCTITDTYGERLQFRSIGYQQNGDSIMLSLKCDP